MIAAVTAVLAAANEPQPAPAENVAAEPRHATIVQAHQEMRCGRAVPNRIAPML